ncbi:MAG: hypothetical protein QM765_41780 [Myxococcales bacterium]
MHVQLAARQGNIVEVPSDLLLLKYAQGFHGGDAVVCSKLIAVSAAPEQQMMPAIGAASAVESRGAIAAPRVLFVGTPPLRDLGYPEIRTFARRAIASLATLDPPVVHLTTTVHGANYGLDAVESLQSMVAGFQQGLSEKPLPALRTITFVERNARRAELLAREVAALPQLVVPETPKPASAPSATAPVCKRRVFVAMPFTDGFEDVWQFGIYETVRRCGYVCERVDESAFAGAIMDRIQDGIRAADFVVADLSEERPNVYLEVGYAWGIGKPVVLTAREGTRLHFDLAHHKCLFYKSAYRLSQDLERQVRDLFLRPT